MSDWTDELLKSIKKDVQTDDKLKQFMETGGRINSFKVVDCTDAELEMSELQEKYVEAFRRIQKEGKKEFPIIKGEK